MKRWMAMLLSLFFCVALAQTPEARQTADQAAQGWVQGKYRIQPDQVGNTREVVMRFLRFQQAVPVEKVDIQKGQYVSAQQDRELYVYPLEGNVKGNVLIEVQKDASGWQTRSVRTTLQNVGIPSWLKGPAFVWGFTLISVVFLLGMVFPTPIRTGFVHAWKVALRPEYRVWFWTPQVLLYGSFLFGMFSAYQDPELARELQAYLGSTLTSTGIQQFMGAGVMTLATGITLWNFFSGAVLTTFLPGLFFGFPAVLFNLLRFSVLGIGLSPALIPMSSFIPHIPVMVLELQAYIFVASFAVVTLIRMFKEGFGKALKEYPLSLLVAFVFLLLGNWYEAFELLYLIPRS